MATFQSLSQIYGLLSLMTLRLDDDNFITWSFQFQTLLKSLDLFGYVDGSIIFPTKYVNGNDKGEIDVVTSTYKEWKKTDMAILSLMLASLSFDIMDYVVGSKTSREAWMRLNERYVPTSRSHVMQLKTDLYTITKKNDSIEKYMLRVTRTRNQLAAIGVRMEDEDIVVAILNGLPAEFNLIKAIIRARESSISMEELRILLLNAERDIATRELVKNSGVCQQAESQIIRALSENNEGGAGDRIGTNDIYGNREYGVGWEYFFDKNTDHGDIVVFGSVCDKTAGDRDLFTLEVPSDGNNDKFLSYGAEKGGNAESGNLGNGHSKKAEMSNSNNSAAILGTRGTKNTSEVYNAQELNPTASNHQMGFRKNGLGILQKPTEFLGTEVADSDCLVTYLGTSSAKSICKESKGQMWLPTVSPTHFGTRETDLGIFQQPTGFLDNNIEPAESTETISGSGCPHTGSDMAVTLISPSTGPKTSLNLQHQENGQFPLASHLLGTEDDLFDSHGVVLGTGSQGLYEAGLPYDLQFINEPSTPISGHPMITRADNINIAICGAVHISEEVLTAESVHSLLTSATNDISNGKIIKGSYDGCRKMSFKSSLFHPKYRPVTSLLRDFSVSSSSHNVLISAC